MRALRLERDPRGGARGRCCAATSTRTGRWSSSLAEEFDLEQVALAAVRLAHEASGVAAGRAGDRAAGRPRRRVRPRHRAQLRRRRPEAPRAARAADRRARRPGCSSAAAAESGIRPQDLVGAVTGESSLSGRDIGAIEIFERFSLVEVPEAAADEVVAALRRTLIKGRKPTVRREHADRRPPRRG